MRNETGSGPLTGARSPRSCAGLLLVAVAGVACYNYAPVREPTPDPGSQVVITLNDSGTQELARYLGPRVEVVRGRYLGSSDQGLLVAVSAVGSATGLEQTWAGETVALPPSYIDVLQVRRLARGRSAMLVGASVTVLAVVSATFVLIGGGSRPGSGGGPGPQ